MDSITPMDKSPKSKVSINTEIDVKVIFPNLSSSAQVSTGEVLFPGLDDIMTDKKSTKEKKAPIAN